MLQNICLFIYFFKYSASFYTTGAVEYAALGITKATMLFPIYSLRHSY